MRSIRQTLKDVLDRRYVPRDEIPGIIASANIKGDTSDDPARAFIGDDDPDELRKRLYEAHRIAVEAAQAVETVLQQELLIWQAIDSIDPRR